MPCRVQNKISPSLLHRKPYPIASCQVMIGENEKVDVTPCFLTWWPLADVVSVGSLLTSPPDTLPFVGCNGRMPPQYLSKVCFYQITLLSVEPRGDATLHELFVLLTFAARWPRRLASLAVYQSCGITCDPLLAIFEWVSHCMGL